MAQHYKSCFCGVIVDAIRLVCFWSKFSNIVVRRILVGLQHCSSVSV